MEMGIKAESAADQEAIIHASARFAASAVARLARALHEKGVIDDFVIGELAAAASESGVEQKNARAEWAMEVVRAQLGQPSRNERLRQTAADEAEAEEDAAGIRGE